MRRASLLCGCALLAVLSSGFGYELREGPSASATFPPKIEEKYGAFLHKMAAARRLRWAEEMTRRQAEWGKAAGITPEQAAALEKAAGAAMDASLADWTAKMDAFCRKQIPAAEAAAVMEIEQAEVMVEFVLQPELPFAYVSPFEQPAWQEALRGTLDAAQLGSWLAKDTERTQAIALQVREVLTGIEEQFRQSFTAPFLAEAREIRSTLLLDPERSAKLEAQAKAEAETSVAERRQTVLRQYLDMDQERLRAWLAQRDTSGTRSEIPVARDDARWNATVAGLLTPEEAKRLAAARSDRSARQQQAIGQAMVLVLDDRLGLTQRQREQMQSLAQRLTKDDPSFRRPAADGSDEDVTAAQFRAAAARAKDADLQSILDAAQLRRWKSMGGRDPVSPEGAMVEQAAPAGIPVSLPSEPEALEGVLSDFFAQQEPATRRRLMDDALLEVEGVARVCGVTGEPLRRLETAARGAMEGELKEWRRSLENSARSRLHGTGEQSLPELLAAVQSSDAPSEERVKIEDRPVWKETLREVRAGFTPAQRAAWDMEGRAREEFRQSTIVRSVTADFDRQYLLTPGQPARLEEQLAAVVKEYEPELSERLGESSWYLQLPGKFVIVAGIPSKVLQEILNPEQWAAWNVASTGNLANTWKMVSENHTHK